MRGLNLTRANIIFTGGGRFYILAYNTKEAKEKISKMVKRSTGGSSNTSGGGFILQLAL
ncbi:hypothetical protein [Archaeoglobus sp.]